MAAIAETVQSDGRPIQAVRSGLRPVGDQVAILPDVAAGSTEGGIALPDDAQEKPNCGTILAVGPGLPRVDAQAGEKSRVPMQLRVDDRVLFKPFSGAEVEIPGLSRPLRILRESEVLAAISREGEKGIERCGEPDPDDLAPEGEDAF